MKNEKNLRAFKQGAEKDAKKVDKKVDIQRTT